MTEQQILYRLLGIERPITIRDIVNDSELCDALGYSPWCINEGRATGDEELTIEELMGRLRHD